MSTLRNTENKKGVLSTGTVTIIFADSRTFTASTIYLLDQGDRGGSIEGWKGEDAVLLSYPGGLIDGTHVLKYPFTSPLQWGVRLDGKRLEVKSGQLNVTFENSKNNIKGTFSFTFTDTTTATGTFDVARTQ